MALGGLQQNMNSDEVKFLIIDEMSMLSQKNLTWINRRLQQASGKMHVPFGGYSVLLMGDFDQLQQPVCGRALFQKPEPEKDNTGFLLDRNSKKQFFCFKQMLKCLSRGNVKRSHWKFLMKRSVNAVSSKDKNEFKDALLLFTTNEKCAEHNLQRLKALGNPIAVMHGRHIPQQAKTGTSEQAGRSSAIFALCKGAKVMLTRNLCTEQGLINWSFGIVKAIIYEAEAKPPA